MKRELKILFEIFALMGGAFIMQVVVSFLGFPVDFNNSLLIYILCRVARLSVKTEEGENT